MDKLIASTEGGMVNSYSKMNEMFCTLFGGADSLSCKVSKYRSVFGFLRRYFWCFITNRRVTNPLKDVVSVRANVVVSPCFLPASFAKRRREAVEYGNAQIIVSGQTYF